MSRNASRHYAAGGTDYTAAWILLTFLGFLGAHRFDHLLGLVWRNDFVFQPLEDDHRAIQSIREMDRRTFEVEIAPTGIGADELVAIARLELVGVFHQGFQVADAVVAGAGFENISECQRA